MEKAIEIKRRAQRCIQSGDLDGALNEYEKLVGAADSDPYNYVLLADLLYKKGDHGLAAERYLSAVEAYERASLYKNAIAVCKKMMRLSLTPAKVLQSLASLHALDGLVGEASLYYVQYAEHMVRSSSPAEAAGALRKAFDVSPDNVRILEQLSETWLLAGEPEEAAQTLQEAANQYRQRGAGIDAQRCLERARVLRANHASAAASVPPPPALEPSAAPESAPPALPLGEPEPGAESVPPAAQQLAFEPGTVSFGERPETASPAPAEPAARALLDGFETGRHELPPALRSYGEPQASEPPALEEPPAQDAPAAPPTADTAAEQEAAEVAGDDEQVYEVSNEEIAEIYELDEPARAEDSEQVEESEQVYVISENEAEPSDSPATPGLAFEPTAAQAAPAPEATESPLAHVEALLARAQEQFRVGDREEASYTLADAAQAYEALGRYDHAATIYRSLAHGTNSNAHMLGLWLANCVERGDAAEAAQVACELGDRALSDNDVAAARVWFERSLTYDAQQPTALRRLARLADEPATPAPTGQAAVATAAEALASEPGTAAPAPVTEAMVASAPAAVASGRIEVALGRAEAVSFDLAAVLSEFQRGVEAQLAGDAQSHYDLGMTYREMGLHDQAMESFRAAQQDPRFAARALEMTGRSLADLGRYHEAAGAFRRALVAPGVDADNDGELRYHLGAALSESGDYAGALAEYEQVAERMPGFEDVDQRLVALRRMLGQG